MAFECEENIRFRKSLCRARIFPRSIDFMLASNGRKYRIGLELDARQTRPTGRIG